ncbi:MAG: presenilin family intramembrane aspartyl protease PSH [Halobacteria archaeon]|nr:presenilin family intramembrane aspartyl protease PSH [Halobacteria archaeon]
MSSTPGSQATETGDVPQSRKVLAILSMAGLLLAVELLALGLVPEFDRAGLQATENPQDPLNSVFYIGIILIFTLLMLIIIKYDVKWIIRAVILLSAASLSFYALSVVLPLSVALVFALGIGVLLYVYPEWYVIDGAGVLMGAGGAGIFGISLGIVPSLVLLVILAVYDAIAVYRTKHMLTLAEGVMDLRLPIMFVVPTRRGYSFIEEQQENGNQEEDTSGSDKLEGSGERDAFFMGLGDAVIPSILIASSAHFIGGDLGLPIALNYPALGGIIGSLIGFVALMYFVTRGKAQAGLPLLNGGTIGGFLVGVLALGIPLSQLV